MTFCWQTASSLLFASVESSKTFFYKRSIRFPRLSTTSHTTVWSLTSLPMFTSPPLRVAFLQALAGCPAPSRGASTPPLTGATAYHSMQKELTIWNRAVNSSLINDRECSRKPVMYNLQMILMCILIFSLCISVCVSCLYVCNIQFCKYTPARPRYIIIRTYRVGVVANGALTT